MKRIRWWVFGYVMAVASVCHAVELPIKGYAPGTFIEPERDAALLEFFDWRSSLAALELEVGDESPPVGGRYDLGIGIVEPGVSTTVLLDLAGVGTFNPAVAELTVSGSWSLAPPPWDNDVMDFINVSGSTDDFRAGDFGCTDMQLNCDVSITLTNLVSLVNMMDNQIEIVFDYYDGDFHNQLGVFQDVPFVMSGFQLLVPEPNAAGLLLLSLAASVGIRRRCRSKPWR